MTGRDCTLMSLPNDILSLIVHHVMDPLQLGDHVRVVEHSYRAGLGIGLTCRRMRHLFEAQLQSLELWQTGRISARCVASLATRVGPRLRRLVLRGCARALSCGTSLSAVSIHVGGALRTLDVSHTTVSEDSLARALARLHGLRELRVRGCFALGDNTLQAIGSHCYSLAALDVSELPSVTDAGVAALAKASGGLLRSLAVSRCVGLTDNALRALAQYGTGLRSLTMRALPLVTNEGVDALCKARGATLTTLDVLDCERLHVDSYLESVRRYCPRIAYRVAGACGRSLRQVVISSLAGNIFYVTGSDICNGKAAVYFLLVDSGTSDSFRVSIGTSVSWITFHQFSSKYKLFR